MFKFFKKLLITEEKIKIDTNVCRKMRVYDAITEIVTSDRDDIAYILNKALVLAKDVVILDHGEEVTPDNMNRHNDHVVWCNHRGKFFNVDKEDTKF